MEIKVGQKYRWPSDPFDIATITKVEGTKYWFTCDSDDYEGEGDSAKDLVVGDDTISEKNLIEEEVSAITPSHYNSTKIDALSVIDDWELDFYLGNTVKYIQRYTKKGKPLEDLKKAAQYLALKIQKLKDEHSK